MEEIDGLHMLPGTCLACKYLRRRCDENCIVAQYFPSEKAEDFQNVHRVFGIQNAMKIISCVEENDRDKTVETLILEAKIRVENPVHGPIAVERKLRAEVEELTKELDNVKLHLQAVRGDAEALVQQEAAPPPPAEEADHPLTPEIFDEKLKLWQIDGPSDQ